MNKVDLFLMFHHKNHAALNKPGSGGPCRQNAVYSGWSERIAWSL
ncbi:hypothetical protein ENTCAN_08204 [Enterobacter cancerogenus ATCC 35316]|nr:hypothetical protein ENTCAN_08204 [Enterobacter cancerogenus ATCC 35316]